MFCEQCGTEFDDPSDLAECPRMRSPDLLLVRTRGRFVLLGVRLLRSAPEGRGLPATIGQRRR